MSQPSHKAAYTRFSIRITSGDYSRIDFYGLVDKRPDTGDGGLRNSPLSTGVGPGTDPRPRIVMTDSSTGERTLLEAPAENVYFHLWAQLKEGAAYQLEVRGLTVTYAYLSECADILEKGIRLIDMSPAREGAGIPGDPPSQTATHFEPPCRWMNDPNGLCRFQGRYHLFYQFNPFDWNWGPMHWAHAVSADLVHWTHLPVAIDPQESLYRDPSLAGGAFSGSALTVDESGDACPGDRASAIRLFLTWHQERIGDNAHQTEYQTTCLCGDGVHVSEQTVLVPGDRQGLAVDFRDPKVDMTALSSWRESPHESALMAVATNLPARSGQEDLLSSAVREADCRFFLKNQQVSGCDFAQMRGDQGDFVTTAWGQADSGGDNEPTAGLSCQAARDLPPAGPAQPPAVAGHQLQRERIRLDRIPSIVGYLREPGQPMEDPGSWRYLGPLLMDYRHGISKTFECPDVFELDGHVVIIGALMHYRDSQGRFQPVRWYMGEWEECQGYPRFAQKDSGWCDFGDSYYATQSFLDQKGRRIVIGWVSDHYDIRQKSTSHANGAMTYPRQLSIKDDRLYSHPVEEVYQNLLGPSRKAEWAPDSRHGRIRTGGLPYYADIRFKSQSVASDCHFLLAGRSGAALHCYLRQGRLSVRTEGLPSDPVVMESTLDSIRRIEVFMDGTVCELFLNDGEDAATILFDSSHRSREETQTDENAASIQEQGRAADEEASSPDASSDLVLEADKACILSLNVQELKI